MATENPLRRPSIPGMNVRERPMTGPQAQMFGMERPTAAPAPYSGGVSAVERPMAAGERAQFGLKPAPVDIGPEALKRAQDARAARTAAPRPVAPVTPAAPPTVAPGQRTLMQRVGGGLRGLGGMAARAAPVAALGATAAQVATTPTEDYRTRFGMQTDDPTLAGDIGVRALGAVSDLGNTLTLGALRPMFRDQREQDQGTPAAPAPVASPAGAGRGNPESPLRTDRDPSSAAFGASRDFTPELSSVPARMPGDLRKGVIFKTQGPNGTVYSGQNVSGDAQMVDGMGATLRGRGTVSTVPGISRDEIDRTLGRGAYAPDSGSSAPMPQGAAPGSLLDTPRARRAMESLRQGRETLSNQRRGQDLSFASQMADTNERRESRNSTAREKAAAAAETRRRTAGYMQQGGGDPLSAAKAARLAGDVDVAAELEKGASGEDKIALQRSEAYRKALAPLATMTDKDGKGRVDDAALERYVGMADSAANMVGKSVEELQANPAMLRGAIKLVESMNNEREDSWLKRAGLVDADPISQLPKMEQGGLRARTEKVLNPVSASGFGARRINLPNGGQVTIGKDAYDDPEIRDLLASLGVK